MMSAAGLVRKSSHVVYQNLAGEEGAVLLNLETGFYYGLDPVGARIWELLDTPRSEAQLQERVAEEFAVDPARAAADVQTFLASLRERELIETDPPA